MEEQDKHFMPQTYQVLGSKIKSKLENYQFYMLKYKEQHKHKKRDFMQQISSPVIPQFN